MIGYLLLVFIHRIIDLGRKELTLSVYNVNLAVIILEILNICNEGSGILLADIYFVRYFSVGYVNYIVTVFVG